MRAVRRLVACLVAALALAPPAAASAHVALVLVPHLDPARYAERGAVGLLVPGAGATVTGAGALAALERGRVVSSLVGGVPHGPILVRPSRRAGEITFYVSLPGPGSHRNVVRYPIAVVGGGYRGLLTSSATRVPGLVSVADVAPAVVALRKADRPALRWTASRAAVDELRTLDRQLSRAHASRGWANAVLVGAVGGLAGLSLAARSATLARAAVLAGPAAVAAALLLSAADLTHPAAAVVALLALTLAASLAVAAFSRGRRLLAAALLAVFPVELVVLAFAPETNALAVIGPHPDGGVRFYGVTNQVETLLLVPALLAGALLGRSRLAPVLLLGLLTVGAARTGADGGGGVVLVAAFLVLGLRLYDKRLSGLRLAGVAAGALGLLLAFVALEAATGDTSHVSRALSRGPVDLASFAFHRLHVAAAGAVASIGAFALFALGIAGLGWLATRRPREPVLEALLVGLAVSLLVNDSPTEIAFYGALSGLALWVWCRASSPDPGRVPDDGAADVRMTPSATGTGTRITESTPTPTRGVWRSRSA